jgi:ArsR family transcriptional regulator, arsenate/arsenite/antimonite-responsive transcriptional repressor
VSRHLAYLRRAGIVASRREGKWMHYRLVVPKDNAAASILHETLKHLKSKPEMRRDVSRLSAACCAPEKYETLQAAPQPAQVPSV